MLPPTTEKEDEKEMPYHTEQEDHNETVKMPHQTQKQTELKDSLSNYTKTKRNHSLAMYGVPNHEAKQRYSIGRKTPMNHTIKQHRNQTMRMQHYVGAPHHERMLNDVGEKLHDEEYSFNHSIIRRRRGKGKTFSVLIFLYTNRK